MGYDVRLRKTESIVNYADSRKDGTNIPDLADEKSREKKRGRDKQAVTKEEISSLERRLRDCLVLLGRVKKRMGAEETRRKMKERGTKAGRKKKRNDAAIRKLRSKGFTIREIARLQDVSTAAVQRAIQVEGGKVEYDAQNKKRYSRR